MSDCIHHANTLRRRLAAVRSTEQRLSLLEGLASATTFSAAFGLLLLCCEAVFHMPSQLRLAAVVLWALATVTGFARYAVKPLLAMLGLATVVSLDTMALRVGQWYRELGDMLCNALQLQTAGGGSAELRAATFAHVAAVADPLDFSVIIDRKPARRAVLIAFVALAVVAASVLLTPTILGSAFDRLVHYDRSYLPPAPFSLSISPADTTIHRGESVMMRISANGVAPHTITVFVRTAGSERFQPFEVGRDTTLAFSYLLPGLTTNAEVYAQGAWLDTFVRTDTARIRVIDRPIIRSLHGVVVAPSYAQLPPIEVTERNADITTLVGSSVSVNLTASKRLASATMLVARTSDTVIVPMHVDGNRATGRWTVGSSGMWCVRITDVDGQTNADPVWWNVVALGDGYPTIRMVDPVGNVDIDTKAKLPIMVAVTDDFGFTSLTLWYRLVRSRYVPADETYRPLPLTIAPYETSQDIGYVWDLNKVGISPEDVYEFYVEVADNDRIAGPKTAKTSVVTVRLPSLDEVFKQADVAQEQAAKELRQIAREAEQLQRESEQLQRELQKQAQQQTQKQADWKERKQAEALMQKQQQLQEKIQEVQQRLEEMTDKLQKNNAISEETLQKYMELQKLMQQVDSPELRRMQEQMRKNMEQLTPEELQKAMQQFKFDEEQFRKNIERTLNLLKRIQAEQKTDELTKRAEELAQRQEELRMQQENTNPNNTAERKKLAEQQKNLREDLDKLAKEMKDLEKLMKELGDMPMDQMEKAQRELDEDGTKQEMSNAEKQTETGDQQKASKSQQQASKNLQRFAQQMKQLKREVKKRGSREAMRQMQKSMNDLVELSKEQEAMRDQTQAMDGSSSQFPEMARRQQRMQEAMSNVANEMMALAQKSMEMTPEMAQDMGDALQAMKNAMQNLQERRSQQAAQQQGQAMQSMNNALSKMSDAMARMMAGEGSGQGGQGQSPGMGEGKGQSTFQRLQSLAEQQQQINQGMQGVGQQGQQMSAEQRAQMGRIAAQQGKALQALQEIEEDQRKNPSGSKKPLGDLSKIAEDMHEVLTDMQTGTITPETRMRQERILSRLLSASRSMNERDYEKTRESRSGVDVQRRSPGPLSNDVEAKQRSQRELLQQLRNGYTRDYENLIRLYFESIQRTSPIPQ
jgi:hypothetical protein